MVNVGGRSRGCETCRQRRVKCDERAPTCRQCARLRLVCPGPKPMRFLEAKIVQSRGRKMEGAPDDSKQSRPSYDSADLVIDTLFSLRCTDLEIYICHTYKYLCLGGAVNCALSEIQRSDLKEISSSAAPRQVSHQAVLSFGIITFGTKAKSSEVLNQGYAMYSRAAKGLNAALSDPNPEKSLGDEVVLSVAALAFLEVFVPSSPETFSNHARGLAQLLELRGAAGYLSPSIAELYRLSRTMTISSSLRDGRPVELRGRKWKDTFRKHCTEKEMLEQDLLDALAECTYLSDPQAQGNPALMEETNWSVLSHLDTFRYRYGCARLFEEKQTSPRGSSLKALRHLWKSGPPTPYRIVPAFDGRPTTYLMMLYYQIFVHLLRALESRLSKESAVPFSADMPQLDLALLSDIPRCATAGNLERPQHVAALQICSYIPVYQAERPRYKSGSSPFAHWAIVTAWQTLGKNESTVGRWIRDLINAQTDHIRAQTL